MIPPSNGPQAPPQEKKSDLKELLKSYSATYNPGWRNYPNFSYKNQNTLIPPTNGSQAPPQEKKSDLEELLKSYINSNEIRLKNQEASLKNLENQVGQLANLLSERSHGALPSNTEKNPREEAKAVTLRMEENWKRLRKRKWMKKKEKEKLKSLKR